MSGENKGAAAAESKKPADSDFQQQRLRAWQPLLTPFWVILTFSIIGALFLILGAICLAASKSVTEITSMSYEHPDNMLPLTNQVLDINITSDMPAPVYVYYKLTNFYQNHRRYVSSRADNQLRGETGYSDTTCTPLTTDGAGKIYYPCGLIANSMFNDTLSLTSSRPAAFSYRNTGIAWQSDIDSKFLARSTPGPLPSETTIGAFGQPLPNVTDENLIVWMRTAGLPTFKKLKFVITTDLKAGDVISVHIDEYFRVTSFGGTKSIVISTANWLGGKNDFLGIAYLVVGAICVVLAIAFAAKHHFSPRPLGDMKYFNWPSARAVAH